VPEPGAQLVLIAYQAGLVRVVSDHGWRRRESTTRAIGLVRGRQSVPLRVPTAVVTREAQPGLSAVVRSPAMNKPAWIVVGVVITLLDSSLRCGERA
jgi:hypothetical protein